MARQPGGLICRPWWTRWTRATPAPAAALGIGKSADEQRNRDTAAALDAKYSDRNHQRTRLVDRVAADTGTPRDQMDAWLKNRAGATKVENEFITATLRGGERPESAVAVV